MKLSLCVSDKRVQGHGDKAPLILNLDTRWRWDIGFKLWPLYPSDRERREGMLRTSAKERSLPDIGSRWKWLANFTLRRLCPGERAIVTHWMGAPRAGQGVVTRRETPFSWRGISLLVICVRNFRRLTGSDRLSVCRGSDDPVLLSVGQLLR